MFSREPEFSGNELADAVRKVRRRIMVNRWLRQWITACNWIFAALILLVAMLRFLRDPLVAGGCAIALAAVVAGVRIRCLRPSAYEAAQQLDSASRQNDRFATAVYFRSASDPSPILLQQREDAVDRVRKLDPGSFFPIRMPARTPWTAGLVAAFGVLCAFHASYGPPLPALREKLAESRAIAAIVAPFSQILESVESEQPKTSPGDGTEAGKRELADSRKFPGLQSSPDSMRNGLAGAANIQPQGVDSASKGILSASSQNRDALEPGRSNSLPPVTGVQIQGRNPAESSQNRAGQGQNPTASNNKAASLASRALQSLESMLEGALAQSNNGNANRASASEAASQQQQTKSDTASQGTPGAPQSGAAPPTKGASGRSNDGMDISSTSNHTPLSGAGSAAPAWQLQANRDKTSLAKMTPEHVPLESNGFAGPLGKDQANVGGGTAQVPLQNVAPPAVATVNGAGQDTVPMRYRQYVRDYFKLGKN